MQSALFILRQGLCVDRFYVTMIESRNLLKERILIEKNISIGLACWQIDGIILTDVQTTVGCTTLGRWGESQEAAFLRCICFSPCL